MSCIHNESILESLYDEVWEEYRVSRCLSADQLYALEQNSETGSIPEIVSTTNQRFEALCH